MTDRTSQLGFTLIELLVVMVLLAGVMAMSAGSLYTMAQTQSRLDQWARRTDARHATADIIRQTLARAGAQKPGAPSHTFTLAPSRINWLGIMPARPAMGGRYWFRLDFDRSSRELSLWYAVWHPGDQAPASEGWARHALAQDVTDALFEAQRADRTWTSTWAEDREPPKVLRISWTDASGTWVPIIVRLTPPDRMAFGQGGFVVGGSGQH